MSGSEQLARINWGYNLNLPSWCITSLTLAAAFSSGRAIKLPSHKCAHFHHKHSLMPVASWSPAGQSLEAPGWVKLGRIPLWVLTGAINLHQQSGHAINLNRMKMTFVLRCKPTTACCGQLIAPVGTVALAVAEPVLGHAGVGAQAAEGACSTGHWAWGNKAGEPSAPIPSRNILTHVFVVIGNGQRGYFILHIMINLLARGVSQSNFDRLLFLPFLSFIQPLKFHGNYPAE